MRDVNTKYIELFDHMIAAVLRCSTDDHLRYGTSPKTHIYILIFYGTLISCGDSSILHKYTINLASGMPQKQSLKT